MFLFDGAGQHDNFASTLQNEREALPGRADLDQPAKHPAKAPYLNPQTRAMRRVDESCSECPRQENVSRYISRPRFRESASEGEQHGTSDE